MSIDELTNKILIDVDKLKVIKETQPQFIRTKVFDRNGVLIDIELNLLNTHLNKENKELTLYYTGTSIETQPALVTLKINDSSINGLISDRSGNYNYYTDQDYEIKFDIDNSKNKKSWTCHDLPAKYLNEQEKSMNFKNQNTTSDTIKIVFVCDYELYKLNNYSRSAVISYVNDMFHQVQSLYYIEGINLSIQDIIVWETEDPYSKSSNEDALISFKNEMGTEHSGTLAHLLSSSTNLSGGIAFINGLCNRAKSFGYSNVYGAFDPNGNYSWDVHVVAHEIGHNLGSQHTHDCAWGPEGIDAIDSCGEPSPECDDAPIPTQGGTIMSYCHNTNVGVNFSLGFGPQPSERMKQTISLCGESAGTSCGTATPIIENGLYLTGPINKGAGATDHQATHAKWYSFTPPRQGTIELNSCNQGIDTRLFIYSGECSDLTQIESSDDDCFSGSGFNYASEVIDLIVHENIPVFIEWDDRWSNEGFQFVFTFIPDSTNTCNNGIQDGNETDIDCGGDCTPCEEICNDSNPLPMIIETPISYRSMKTVRYGGLVVAEAKLAISTAESTTMDNNFTLEIGGELEITKGVCQEN